jgi:hypothetical protein
VAIGVASIVFIESILDLLSGASPLQIGVAFQTLCHTFVTVARIAVVVALVPTTLVGLVVLRSGAHAVYWYLVMGGAVGLGAMVICLVWFDLEYRVGILRSEAAYVLFRFGAASVLAGVFGGLVFWVIAGRNTSARLGLQH